MKMKPYAMARKMADRINTAVKHVKDCKYLPMDQLLDALCMTGFELEECDQAYWGNRLEKVLNLIQYIRDYCTAFERGDVEDPSLVEHCAPNVVNLLNEIATDLELLEISSKKLPVATSPVQQLFLHKPEPDKKAEELQAEKSVKRQQTLTRIIVMQTQMDNALQRLESDILKAIFGED